MRVEYGDGNDGGDGDNGGGNGLPGCSERGRYADLYGLGAKSLLRICSSPQRFFLLCNDSALSRPQPRLRHHLSGLLLCVSRESENHSLIDHSTTLRLLQV